MIETPQFAAMMRRMLKAWVKRVGAGDTVDLAEMIEYHAELDRAIADAIALGRANEAGAPAHSRAWSWAKIAAVLTDSDGRPLTRQGAEQKYGRDRIRARKSSNRRSVRRAA